MKKWLVLLLLGALAACQTAPQLPSTDGESRTSFTYIPLDPLSITRKKGKSCDTVDNSPLTVAELLEALPDQTVRMAVKKFNTNGSVSYAAFASAGKNETYEVILDYMNTDTAPGTFLVKRYVVKLENYKAGLLGATYKRTDYMVGDSLSIGETTPASVITQYHVVPFDDTKPIPKEYKDYSKINVPIYVGLGLRLKANITTLEADVNLSGLPAIAAQAQAGKVRGSLVVQTLGVSGKNIATALPLPSELNETTLTNSVLSMGAIKAMIHDDNTFRTARVVGFYNPFGGGEAFVNALIDALSESRHPWYRSCEEKV
jgi:hypothetical protein